MNFSDKWQEASKKFAALSQREKILIIFVGFTVLYMGWKYGVSKPLAEQKKAGQKQTAQYQQQITQVQEKMNEVLQVHQDDSGESIFDKEKRLKSLITEVDDSLRFQSGSLVDPNLLINAVRDILEKNNALTLISLKNFEPEGLVEPSLEPEEDDDESDDDEQAREMPVNDETMSQLKGVYSHRLELKFTGQYLEVFNYLHALEQLPWQFFWDELTYDVIKHPFAVVTIKLHTLSSEKEQSNGA